MKRMKKHSAADEILNLHKVAGLQRRCTQKVISIIVLQTVSTAVIPSTQTVNIKFSV